MTIYTVLLFIVYCVLNIYCTVICRMYHEWRRSIFCLLLSASKLRRPQQKSGHHQLSERDVIYTR